MKFCKQCGSVLNKTTATGEILFICRCQLPEEGKPDDTLIAEGYLETSQSNLKHDVFIENSSFDPAANIVLKDCPKCNLNFMTMVIIGIHQVSMYTCSCGYQATHDEYMKYINKK